MRILSALTATLLLTVFAATAESQTGTGACPSSMALAVNPSWVCATPSLDPNGGHNATTNGVPVIVRYDLLLFAPGANTATGNANQTIPIGKPALNAQGAFWVQVPALAQLPPGEDWKARIVAIGQPLTAGGPAQVSARSPESNPFERALPPPTAPAAPLGVSVPPS